MIQKAKTMIQFLNFKNEDRVNVTSKQLMLHFGVLKSIILQG